MEIVLSMILELDAQRSNLFSHLYQSIWWRASVYAVHVHFRSTVTDAWPILVRIPRESIVVTLIYLLSIPFETRPWHRVPRARKIARKPVPYIGIPPSGVPSVRVTVVCVKHIVRTCVSVHVCAFASCGFVVCPEGRTTSCLRESRFICVSFAPHLPGVTSSPLLPLLSPGSTHRSPACV